MRRFQQTAILTSAIAAITLNGDMASAQPDTNSANHFMPGCRSFATEQTSNDLFSSGRCAGIIDGISFADPDICTPNGVTFGQLVRVVVQYIDARPARMHESFRRLVTEALQAAWPCKRR